MITISQVTLARGRPIPDTTQVKITCTGAPGKLQVLIRLPWQSDWKDLGLIPVVGTELVLPLKLAFLCHAKEDKKQVEEIGSRLLEDGILTWYDDKDLLPGDDWEDVIEREIEGCDFFLAFLSSRSLSKIGYVNRELRYALEQGDRRPLGQRFIIPVLLDECRPPRELKRFHFMKSWEAGAYDKLVKVLSAP